MNRRLALPCLPMPHEPPPSHPSAPTIPQAEEEVVYPALQAHCGPEGALLVDHARREHVELGREVGGTRAS